MRMTIPFLFLLLWHSSVVHAFQVEPMVVSIPLTGKQESGTYTIQNNTQEKIAAQFEVRRRVIDENGKEERPSTTEFLIFPEQMSLEPGQKRNVRVTWTGPTTLDKEQAYRFIATQLPIEFKKSNAKDAKLKFLIEYVASLYIVPPNVKAKMKVEGYGVNKDILEIKVANEGSAHFLLDRMQVSVKGDGKELKLDAPLLQNLRTENILPGGKRILRIPLPKNFPKPTVDVAFVP